MSKARTSICADCGTSFSYEIVRGSHGRTYCPACRDARVLQNKRIYKVRHREKVLADAREYARMRYQNDPEHAERQREHSRNLTPEKRREIQQRWYETNRHKHGHWPVVKLPAEESARRNAECTKRWVEAHPDRVRIIRANSEQRRRARKLGVPNEPIDRVKVYERDGGRCHICGKTCSLTDFHVDHLVPLSKGGWHTYENVAVAHARCNLKRGPGRIPAQLLLIGGV